MMPAWLTNTLGAIAVYLACGLPVSLGILLMTLVHWRAGRLPNRPGWGHFGFTMLWWPIWPLAVYLAVKNGFLVKVLYCTWCGKAIDHSDDVTWRRHLLECEQHPARPVIEAAAELLNHTHRISLPEDAVLAEMNLGMALGKFGVTVGWPEEARRPRGAKPTSKK